MEKQKFLDIDEKKWRGGDSGLHVAARSGSLGKVKELIVDKDMLCLQNQQGETALYVAAEYGHTLVVAEMLKHLDLPIASLVANNGYDAFQVAAKQGHLDVLKELLHSFPNLVMATDSCNFTALHTAVAQGHVDVVNLLLEIDSKLAKIARNNGKTVLHTAARMGHLAIVKSLVSKDPEICFRKDSKGQTALHMAVKGQNVHIIHELITPNPAVLALQDNKGNTPLHIATRKGRAQVVQCLIPSQGINLNAVNKAGETALDIAEKFGMPQLVSILKVVGADHGKPPSNAKQLKQTVSDIRHDVQSQLQQSRQTGFRVRKIAKKVKKLHISGLNNAINNATVVAVLIATVAFAAIFTVPGQYVEHKTNGFSLGEAHVANTAAFIIFFLFDSMALFISIAVVIVQTSLVVIEPRAKKLLIFWINRLMWAACLFISVSFISLAYVVVGSKERWLAIYATVVGSTIMLITIGSMCYCVVRHRLQESTMRSIRSGTHSMSVASDTEIYTENYKRMFAV